MTLWFFDQNDPCDEWPRHVIRRSVGLQACGCPALPTLCACPTSSGPHECALGHRADANYYDTGARVEPHPGLGE